MSPIKIYEIHRATNGQCKIFNDGYVSLSRKRSGCCNRDIEITIVASAILAIAPKSIANATDG